jgi:hypothetical protein
MLSTRCAYWEVLVQHGLDGDPTTLFSNLHLEFGNPSLKENVLPTNLVNLLVEVLKDKLELGLRRTML